MPTIEANNARAAVSNDAIAYQDAILPKVSRTFALTIPQLPPELSRAVANAYLLCRIADTIEDEPNFSAQDKRHYEEAFIDAVTGRINAHDFAAELAARLSTGTPEDERELLRHMPLVLEVTRGLRPMQLATVVNCLKVMAHGMFDFQRGASLSGLDTLRDLDRYCYCVAGVVGEMLTDLFVDFEPALKPHRDAMMRLAISFGQGLQMTNILKDQWEDRERGVSWLPRDTFARHGVRLDTLRAGESGSDYAAALNELIGVAHAHLRRALDYTLLIPAHHAGIRRFCLWAIGLALLTLRNLHENPGFSASSQIKVPRSAVARTIALTRLTVKHNAALRWLFAATARRLPLTALASEWNEAEKSGLVWPKNAIAYFTESDAWRDLADVHDAQVT